MRRGARFEELADVCDANELWLGLGVLPVDALEGHVLTIAVSDGAEGMTRVSTCGCLDVAAELVLQKLRHARVVP